MSNIKEQIARQLMGSKTGLLSVTIAERLNETKEIVNSTLEEMRQIQDVKKGSKAGLDNYRWTMTDMGRLNYRVDEVALDQNDLEVKTNVEVEPAEPVGVPSDVALNPELFELVKVIDEKNAAIFELFNRKPKQIILNRENKINELHKLCGSGILSNGTVAILNDIIGDLQVE